MCEPSARALKVALSIGILVSVMLEAGVIVIAWFAPLAPLVSMAYSAAMTLVAASLTEPLKLGAVFVGVGATLVILELGTTLS